VVNNTCWWKYRNISITAADNFDLILVDTNFFLVTDNKEITNNVIILTGLRWLRISDTCTVGLHRAIDVSQSTYYVLNIAQPNINAMYFLPRLIITLETQFLPIWMSGLHSKWTKRWITKHSKQLLHGPLWVIWKAHHTALCT